jgi:hypothetical protein
MAEKEQYKKPGFTEVTDPELLSAIKQLQRTCMDHGIEISGEFTIWVSNREIAVGYDSVSYLSGTGFERMNGSLGQVVQNEDE